MTEQETAAALRGAFVTTERCYREGTVEVFEQLLNTGGAAPRRATLAITALGLYAAEINGARVGDALLTPGFTYYPYDLHYQVYDVTEALAAQGAPDTGCAEVPVLRVYLAQGWYCGRFTCENKTQIWGERPAVSWVLELELADGTMRRATSADAGVRGVLSPYDYAGLYDGEIYWAADAADGRPAVPEPLPPVPFEGLVSETLEPAPIKTVLHEVREPEAVTERSDGTTIIDFGQNMAGVVEIDPSLIEGTHLRLRHGEILNADGSLYTANLRTAKAAVEYHKGSEHGIWRPRFTYMGFRYVELTGCPWRPGLLRARPVHTAMQRTGFFTCGDERVNRVFENQLWTCRSNYVEVPTDCPQRDERQGYTGDGHAFAQTAAYNYDTCAFMEKFLKDIRMSQRDNTEGYVAASVPATGPAGVGFIGMQEWASADTILPALLFEHYGDRRALVEQYESMCAMVDCKLRQAGEKGLWFGANLGDWLAPGHDIAWAAQHNAPVSGAFMVNDLRIVARVAAYLGYGDDAARYREALARAQAAYRAAFLEEDGRLKDFYQGAAVMALALVLDRADDAGAWSAVFAQLVESLRARGIQTGFYATEHLLPVLVEGGEERLAFDLLLTEDCPGWIFEVNQGATTIWERWDAIRPDGTVNEERTSDQSSENMVSFNHYAFGSVGAFLYRYVLGIRPLEPGFARVLVEPHVDVRLGHAEGSYRSRAGEIRVAWALKGDELAVEATLPVPGIIRLPDGAEHMVEKGVHRFALNR